MVRIIASIVFFAAIAIYMAPSAIAILRAQARWPLVVALNLMLGWTVLGWFAALAMALELRLPRPRWRKTSRASTAAFSAPRAAPTDAAEEAPAREPDEPPKVRDESYARWLESGSATTA